MTTMKNLTCTTDIDELAIALSVALKAAPTTKTERETLPSLAGVIVHFQTPEQLNLIGTDRFVMSRYSLSVWDMVTEMTVEGDASQPFVMIDHDKATRMVSDLRAHRKAEPGESKVTMRTDSEKLKLYLEFEDETVLPYALNSHVNGKNGNFTQVQSVLPSFQRHVETLTRSAVEAPHYDLELMTRGMAALKESQHSTAAYKSDGDKPHQLTSKSSVSVRNLAYKPDMAVLVGNNPRAVVVIMSVNTRGVYGERVEPELLRFQG